MKRGSRSGFFPDSDLGDTKRPDPTGSATLIGTNKGEARILDILRDSQ